ncbi:ATP phosphoribosyltransferase regulatory subunit [Clostridium thermarum]|uniref:ATP phosphoribosyltransferase regulatory subunit n=1 Tax=Clostridium thermarum TaxID=1716543 RepID=UPI0013D70E3C|nr:ATP phosphoribosyltransferase regulatory subunit [Clostridium thermarum]
MGKWKKNIPDGTRDLLFKDCANKRYVEEVLKKIYIDRGFLEIITPTLEFYDVFDGENVWIDQEKMYKLFDNKGRILVLRPDITTPAARLAGTKLKDSFYPLKLCYCQNVFRTNEDLNGKRNEFTQSGTEIIGCSELRADLEVIVTAIKALLAVRVKNFKVELGHIGFFKGIMDELKLEQEEKEKIRKFIEGKNYATLKDFLQSKETVLGKENIEVINSLPALFGDISVLQRAKELTGSSVAQKALKNIEDIYYMLESMGISEYVSLDLGMVHNIDYYTGLIFRAYIEGAGDDVLYGGRYDGLVSNFGLDVPATGFAINVDRILDVLRKQNSKIGKSITPDYIIHSDTKGLARANLLLEYITAKGYRTELSLFSAEEETIEYAAKRKIKEVLFIEGTEEVYIYNLERGIRDKFSLVEEQP